jgi:hypothetical protein
MDASVEPCQPFPGGAGTRNPGGLKGLGAGGVVLGGAAVEHIQQASRDASTNPAAAIEAGPLRRALSRVFGMALISSIMIAFSAARVVKVL